jgi:hypothetical protein
MIDSRIGKIQSYWNTLSIERLDTLGEVYTSSVQFEDPLSKGTGLDELKAHFERIYRSLPTVTYEYGRSIASSNCFVIEWTMISGFRRSKRAFALPGISFLEVDADSGLIFKSREYFDLGQGLYQHVPLLGALVRIVKSNAAKNSR